MASLRQQIATTTLTLTKFRDLMKRMQENRPHDDLTIVKNRKEFGEQVAHIVEGVTKISKIDFATREEQQAENLRKMMLAMVDDIRVVLIKLADRLHNMRTLEHLPAERQHKIAEETLEIYAPIAHRLGMGKIRGELEDLGFRF